jgi:hypothetical protein
MTEGAKAFSQMRIDPGDGGAAGPASAPPRSEARARAAAYLDLWERHLTRLALKGPAPTSWPTA